MKLIFKKNNIFVFQGKNGVVNSTIVEYKNFLILIDTMYHNEDLLCLKKKIDSFKKPIKFIINTHYHYDHFWGNKYLAGQNTVIIGHKNFLKTIKSKIKTKINFKNHFPDMVFHKEIYIENLILLHTPGHTSDSICIYDQTNKILIAGDTILGIENGIKLPPYFFEGNLIQMKKSVEHLMHFDFKTVIPGHFEMVNKENIKEDIIYLENLIDKKIIPDKHSEIYKKIHEKNMMTLQKGER